MSHKASLVATDHSSYFLLIHFPLLYTILSSVDSFPFVSMNTIMSLIYLVSLLSYTNSNNCLFSHSVSTLVLFVSSKSHRTNQSLYHLSPAALCHQQFIDIIRCRNARQGFQWHQLFCSIYTVFCLGCLSRDMFWAACCLGFVAFMQTATSAVQVGIPNSLIQTLDRWKSSAFLSYIWAPQHQLSAVSQWLLT